MEFNTNVINLEPSLILENDPYKDTILSLFKSNVEKTPHQEALVMGIASLTYLELDLLSDYLAATLLSKGLKEDTPVGILLPRSIEFIVSIFGILKAGGAYVPMGPTDGEERLSHIILDTKCPFILTQSQFLNEKLDSKNAQVLNIEVKNGELIDFEKLPFFPKRIKPENLAYIIYTSGTTGLPKGAMIEHRNLFWLIKNYVPVLGPSDRTLQSMSITCDASVVEIFPALGNGATLVLWEDNFSEMLRIEKITHTCMTPSMAEVIESTDCTHLKNLILGGEKLTEVVVKKFPKNVNIFNGYGPTECTVACSNTLIQDPTRIHIGGKLNQAELYVVDSNLKLCSTNQVGELLIGGKGVGRGYWNRPDLTDKKFIPNPFGPGRVYFTGDLVKRNQFNELEYLGRADRQVKVRGFRLELDGVEGIINQFQGVTGSHLVLSNHNLIAYITPQNIDLSNLKIHLEKNLPKHAIPFRYMLLENFPLNAAGKIDVKKLPQDNDITETKENLPQTKVERDMSDLWTVNLKLGNYPISLDDNFFDLGGNSLNAIKLTHSIRKKYSDSNIPLELIYKFPTLRDYLSSLNTFNSKTPVPTSDKKQDFPLFFDLIKTLPNTLYFVFSWLLPTIAFLFLVFKFPFLIYYYMFELIFFGLFGKKIVPILQIIRNKINLDKFNFYSVNIIESVPLKNTKGVVFCFHPHGLMDTHAQAFERYLFNKNIRFKSTFERKLFWLPFNRTFLYLLGYVPAEKDNYKTVGSSKGNLCTTPGDVAEYLHCHEPSTVFLSTNKIFFKLAIENGLTLIPVYAYDTEKAFTFYPQLHIWRDKLKIGVQVLAIPIFSGRYFLPIPYKTPAKIVIGVPLRIEKKDKPTWEDIENCSHLYSTELEALYDKYKTNEQSKLKIL